MKKKDVAVLVLNYNGKKYLKNCFQSLISQSCNNFDIWLVDNNSLDGSIPYTKKNFKSVKIFNTDDNLGYTGSYNKIHEYFKDTNTEYSYYLFINADTISDSRMITQLLNGFSLEENVGLVSPVILDFKKNVVLTKGNFLFLSGSTLGNYSNTKYKRKSNYVRCFWASGCCFMTTVDLFEKSNGFSDFFMYYEDVDYSWKINNFGYKVIIMQNSYVIHDQGGSKASTDMQMFLIERNRLLTYYKNLPLFFFIPYLPIYIILRLLLLSYFAPTYRQKLSKVKGMVSAMLKFSSTSRHVMSFNCHLQVILLMNRAESKQIHANTF